MQRREEGKKSTISKVKRREKDITFRNHFFLVGLLLYLPTIDERLRKASQKRGESVARLNLSFHLPPHPNPDPVCAAFPLLAHPPPPPVSFFVVLCPFSDRYRAGVDAFPSPRARLRPSLPLQRPRLLANRRRYNRNSRPPLARASTAVGQC